MRIVVIGGSGYIGTKVVNNLRQRGRDVLAASPDTGIDTVTGKGLAEAVAGADVVIDVANPPSLEDRAVLRFFEIFSRTLLGAEAVAGVKHHIALSIVGTDRLARGGYTRAKMEQEDLIRASTIPYTIVRSTQFFEFFGRMARANVDWNRARFLPALFQPIAPDDVAGILAEAALGMPLNGVIDVAEAEPFTMTELVQRFLDVKFDQSAVAT